MVFFNNFFTYIKCLRDTLMFFPEILLMFGILSLNFVTTGIIVFFYLFINGTHLTHFQNILYIDPSDLRLNQKFKNMFGALCDHLSKFFLDFVQLSNSKKLTVRYAIITVCQYGISAISLEKTLYFELD